MTAFFSSWVSLVFMACLGTAGLLLASPVRAEAPAVSRTFEVQRIRNLAYHDGPDADTIKHKLDIYLPREHKNFPVLFFVHGGGWMNGDKSYFGVYDALALLFARHGIAAVVTNYRLSPAVQHPEHIKDVARAFAWTHRNIQKYGGRADQLFVCGHSAGGHLVALLATDDCYLKAHGLNLQAIKGAIPMSGVYEITERLLPRVFGTDPAMCKKASPLSHVRADAPPFLILYAQTDLPMCGRATSEAFCAALKDKKCAAQSLEIKDRNHGSIILKAILDDDPTPQAILRFIGAHTRSE